MRAVLSGYYGFGNGGDEALLSALLQMLPGHVEPVVLAADHRQAARRYGVRTVDRWNLFLVSQAVAGADAFIWGGGSLMQDVTGRGSVLYYGSLMQLAQTLGKRTIAWAQGLGPLKDPWARGYTRKLFSGCTAVSVRDAGSSRLLKEWGVDHELTCDPVWALEPLPPVAMPAGPPRVALVLRPFPDLDLRRQALLIAALDRLQQATGAEVLCIPFQQPGDVELAHAMAEALPGRARVVFESDPRQLMGLFAGVRLSIAMRLHGVLMAAAAGSPVWGLSYDPKVNQLLGQIQAPGCEVSQLPDNPDVLADLWQGCYERGAALGIEERAQWAERARANARTLERVLK